MRQTLKGLHKCHRYVYYDIEHQNKVKASAESILACADRYYFKDFFSHHRSKNISIHLFEFPYRNTVVTKCDGMIKSDKFAVFLP